MITAKKYDEKGNITFYAQADDHDEAQLHARLKTDDPVWDDGVTFADEPRKDQAYFNHRGLAIWVVDGKH